ncbi:hypothetical protein DPMN_141583 [Dreissena polymorpha]|uniref:Uncharacterized protein n=1 Tax=Dreissena polymorpha TaxID=45954 RepID=A0A9D4GD05_DREPO|nr:hypothetical protein DPMN_141583 [Dreissena polymorpha]
MWCRSFIPTQSQRQQRTNVDLPQLRRRISACKSTCDGGEDLDLDLKVDPSCC